MNQKNTHDVHDYITMLMEPDMRPNCASVQEAKCYMRNLIRLGFTSMDAESYAGYLKYSPSQCALTKDNS